jgi:RNA polymerase sigma-54 factor
MAYQISQSMQGKQTQSLKQNQRLIMSPQMQQAISLLQLPMMELSAAIELEMERNPILEYDDDHNPDSEKIEQLCEEITEESIDENYRNEKEVDFCDRDFEIMKHLDEEFRDHFAMSELSSVGPRTQEDDKLQSFLESSITGEISLYEHLTAQAEQIFQDPHTLILANAIIGNLDERGFLEMPLEEISLLNDLDIKELAEVLKEIQTFEPHGVGAKDLRESFLIQLRCMKRQHTLAYAIIDEHYNDLLSNKIPVITRGLKCTAEEVRSAIEGVISKLDMRPGGSQEKSNHHQITPDVHIIRRDGKLLVEINGETIPSLRINQRYMRMMTDPNTPEETREYVKEKIMSGKWLLKNIHQRNDTIFRIGEFLLDKQREFFSQKDGKLTPLTMKAVAAELELHESTIARAVANKYINCPRGVLPLRSFFTNGYATQKGEDISSKTVKDSLRDIVEKEDKRKPLSDETLSTMLKDIGIDCARRTVAKYRKELNIGTATQRRMY